MENDVHHQKQHGVHLATGTIAGFIGSAICLPTGLLTAGFLTRQLGPSCYGNLTVAATFISLIEVTITTGFCRSAEKLLSGSNDKRNASGKFFWVQLLVSIGTLLLVFAMSPFIADLMHTPEMCLYLRFYSIGIPFTAMLDIHISLLIGKGLYYKRAILQGAFWIIRLFLILFLVGIDTSVTAAIAANICASAITLLWARGYIRPTINTTSHFPAAEIWCYAWPLFLYTVCFSIFKQLDLLFLKVLWDEPDVAGYYGATKNLTIVPGLVASSFAPLLLSKLSELIHHGKNNYIPELLKTTMRLIICLLPFAGMSAGASGEIVTAIYGSRFYPAGDLLVILIFGALGIAAVTVIASILIAAGRPVLLVYTVFPVVLFAVLLHVTIIPRFGPSGAAIVTTVAAWTGAIVLIAFVDMIWKCIPHGYTFLRSLIICIAAYYVAYIWRTPGILLLVKMPVISAGIALVFTVFGEFDLKDINYLMTLFRRRS